MRQSFLECSLLSAPRRSLGSEGLTDLERKNERGENATGRMCSMGTIPPVYVLHTGAQSWCLTSSLIPLQQRHTNQREHISSIFFCLFVYLLCTVATVRADIQWWICVIRFQLLICIESVPPGDINQHVCSSLKECWLLVIVTKLQWWDISHYATGAVFQSK